MRAALVGSLLLVAPGCAFDAGEPYGAVRARLEARYADEGPRDLGGGWQKLASDYAVAVDEAVVWIESLDLRVAGLVQSEAFDPANPPAGYGSCHAGHCHADDGSLVSYEEIAAGLGAGADGTVLRLDGGRFDLLAGARQPLACPGDCVLGRGQLSGATLRVTSLRLLGRLRDERDPARLGSPQSFVADLSFVGDPYPVVTLDLPLDLPLDEDSPSRIDLDLRASTGARLLDDVAFDTLPSDALQRLDVGADAAASDALVARLGEIALEATVNRSDP